MAAARKPRGTLEPRASPGGTLRLELKKIGTGHKQYPGQGREKPAEVIRAAAQHNLREQAPDNADPTRRPLNRVLKGPSASDAVVTLWSEAVARQGAKVKRHDQNVALEALFSVPLDIASRDEEVFFRCLEWCESYFRLEVLSAVIHRDEGAPHMHVIMCAARSGSWVASEFAGGVQALRKTKAAFETHVVIPLGLAPMRRSRMNGARRKDLALRVVAKLRRAGDTVTRSPHWHVWRDMIDKDPAPLAQVLGVL